MAAMRRIPPLNALKVFEAAARLGNLTKAAQELNVSQSAVSRQILLIEDYLGVRLLQREARGVSLTKTGAEYQEEIGPAFASIIRATERIQRAEKTLRIRAYTTFAAKWLLRYLPGFEAAYPSIKVQLSTGVKRADFDRDEQDISIEFVMDDQVEPSALKLFSDIIEPVCAPALLQGKIRLETPADLVNFKLLDSHYRTADWPDWLRSVGCSELNHKEQRPSLPSSLLAYQAAAEGLGIALGQTRLLKQELESGRLITPFNSPLERSAGYYLLTSATREQSFGVRIFCEWIQQAIKETQP